VLEKIWSVYPQTTTNLRSQLLENRGIEKGLVDNFLHPRLNALISPKRLFPDLEKAVTRIKKAVSDQELIFVYGDYDVDGITASAILWETLDYLGGKVMPYIPDRRTEGYGINSEALEALARQGAKVVISVDCGITAVEQANIAKKLGIDLIITDHHQPQALLPQPFALLHSTSLSGSGVAFGLATEILNSFNKDKDGQFFKNLELATLGTVADMVPLKADNRIIVSNGLPLLSKSSRVGLISLYSEAGMGKVIGTYEIGFLISPRLNAMGRMESALDSLRLLLTRDKTRADNLAQKLGQTNKLRQESTQKALEHAMNTVERDYLGSKLFVISSPGYEEGIVGLVAGRISEKFHRPTAVISESAPLSKGSARSINSFNITLALGSQAHLLAAHGGHPMAAGFSVTIENINPLRDGLVKRAEESLKEEDLLPVIKIDAEIRIDQVNQELVDLIKEFEPFGIGNPEPLFLTKNLEVLETRLVGKENQHLKIVFRDEYGEVLEGVGFNLGNKNPPEGSNIDIVYSVQENYWHSRKRIEARVKDLRVSVMEN
jgi:single-stranded-DNA-specific exonuclease